MRKPLVTVLSLLLIGAVWSSTASAEGSLNVLDPTKDKYHPQDVGLNNGTAMNVTEITDTTFRKKGYNVVTPDVQECDCVGGTGTYSDPYRLNTERVWIDGTPVEYTVNGGNLIIFERPDLYYYKQNAEFKLFHEASAYLALTAYTGYWSYVSYKVVNSIPYTARLYDKYGMPAPFNYQDYAIASSTYMTMQNVPLWGKVLSAPVPSTGTKDVLVYISTSGQDYTWYKRARFTLYPDQSVKVTTWTVY